MKRLDLTLSPHEERVGREPERGAARGSIAVFFDAPPLPGPLLRFAEERESGASSSGVWYYLPAKQRVRLRLEFLGRQLNIEVSEREVIKECRYPLAALHASL